MAKRYQKKYAPEAVWQYVNQINAEMDILQGCLIDTYILYHDGGVIEVWEEKALNEWSSAYVRHIYRKGLPARFIEALEEQERYYEEALEG